VTVEIVDLTEAEAKRVTGRIRAWVKECPIDDIKQAYFGRVWLALGYESWSGWCDCELDGFKLPSLERREVVAELSGEGMSQRAIADVVGANQATVSRDLAAHDANASPQPVTGQDGKTYTRKKRPVTDTPAKERAGATPYSRDIQRLSASIAENCTALTDEEVAEALGAAQFLYELLRGETILREST
jgi:transposase